jgi:DNA-directed RNA polymerase specialized sigma24 family protein
VDLIPLAFVDNRAQIDVGGGGVADGSAEFELDTGEMPPAELADRLSRLVDPVKETACTFASVTRGLTNRQVAERLFLSQHTVSNHLRHAFAKLEVTSRVELARLAAIHENTAE